MYIIIYLINMNIYINGLFKGFFVQNLEVRFQVFSEYLVLIFEDFLCLDVYLKCFVYKDYSNKYLFYFVEINNMKVMFKKYSVI